MKKNEEVIILQRKTKSVVMILVGAMFVLGGIWLFVFASEHTSYNPVMLKIVGGIVVTLFGIVFLYGVKKLFDKTTGLKIGAKGLVDSSSGPISAGEIPWSQITKIQISTMQFQKFLTIHVRDPESYIARGNLLRQIVSKSNLKSTGSPINISAISLKMNFDDLIKLIQEYYKKYGSA